PLEKGVGVRGASGTPVSVLSPSVPGFGEPAERASSPGLPSRPAGGHSFLGKTVAGRAGPLAGGRPLLRKRTAHRPPPSAGDRTRTSLPGKRPAALPSPPATMAAGRPLP